jgi:hypothetical protein
LQRVLQLGDGLTVEPVAVFAIRVQHLVKCRGFHDLHRDRHAGIGNEFPLTGAILCFPSL